MPVKKKKSWGFLVIPRHEDSLQEAYPRWRRFEGLFSKHFCFEIWFKVFEGKLAAIIDTNTDTTIFIFDVPKKMGVLAAETCSLMQQTGVEKASKGFKRQVLVSIMWTCVSSRNPEMTVGSGIAYCWIYYRTRYLWFKKNTTQEWGRIIMIRGRGELCVWWLRSHIYWFPSKKRTDYCLRWRATMI